MDTIAVSGNSIIFRQFPAFGATTGIFLQWADELEYQPELDFGVVNRDHGLLT